MTEAPALASNEHNLIWIDLEMTGLDPLNDGIIEIAVVVTDPQLQTRVEGPVIAVHQSDARLDAMDAWNKGMVAAGAQHATTGATWRLWRVCR